MRKSLIARFGALLLALVLSVSLCAIPVFADGEMPKIRDNAFKEGIGFRVAMTGPVENPAESFRIEGPEGQLTISGYTDDGGNIYTLTVAEAVDVTASYTISIADQTVDVKMPIY